MKAGRIAFLFSVISTVGGIILLLQDFSVVKAVFSVLNEIVGGDIVVFVVQWIVGWNILLQQMALYITLFLVSFLAAIPEIIGGASPRYAFSLALMSSIEMWIPSGGSLILFRLLGLEAALFWLVVYFIGRLLVFFKLEW